MSVPSLDLSQVSRESLRIGSGPSSESLGLSQRSVGSFTTHVKGKRQKGRPPATARAYASKPLLPLSSPPPRSARSAHVSKSTMDFTPIPPPPSSSHNQMPRFLRSRPQTVESLSRPSTCNVNHARQRKDSDFDRDFERELARYTKPPPSAGSSKTNFSGMNWKFLTEDICVKQPVYANFIEPSVTDEDVDDFVAQIMNQNQYSAATIEQLSEWKKQFELQRQQEDNASGAAGDPTAIAPRVHAALSLPEDEDAQDFRKLEHFQGIATMLPLHEEDDNTHQPPEEEVERGEGDLPDSSRPSPVVTLRKSTSKSALLTHRAVSLTEPPEDGSPRTRRRGQQNLMPFVNLGKNSDAHSPVEDSLAALDLEPKLLDFARELLKQEQPHVPHIVYKQQRLSSIHTASNVPQSVTRLPLESETDPRERRASRRQTLQQLESRFSTISTDSFSLPLVKENEESTTPGGLLTPSNSMWGDGSSGAGRKMKFARTKPAKPPPPPLPPLVKSTPRHTYGAWYLSVNKWHARSKASKDAADNCTKNTPQTRAVLREEGLMLEAEAACKLYKMYLDDHEITDVPHYLVDVKYDASDRNT